MFLATPVRIRIVHLLYGGLDLPTQEINGSVIPLKKKKPVRQKLRSRGNTHKKSHHIQGIAQTTFTMFWVGMNLVSQIGTGKYL